MYPTPKQKDRLESVKEEQDSRDKFIEYIERELSYAWVLVTVLGALASVAIEYIKSH